MKRKTIFPASLFLLACACTFVAQVGPQPVTPQPQGSVRDNSSTVPPLPDLIVERLFYDAPTGGARILIANIGKAQAKACELGFGCQVVVGKGTGSNGKEFEVMSTALAAPVNVAALNAGEKRWVSISMGKLNKVKQCSAVIDQSKVVSESNESNNTMSTK